MSDYKERKDNPLHREFGIWCNTVYIIKKCRQYRSEVILIALLGIICGSVMNYFWGFFSKYVIDLIQSNGGYADNTSRLLAFILIGGALAAALQIGSTFSGNNTWYRFIDVRVHVINERVDKALRMDYEMLERPDVLDVHERATQATGGNVNGVEGMMNLMVTLGRELFTVIVTFVAVTVLDWRLVSTLFLLAILEYLHYRKTSKLAKKEVWDRLAPLWRQINYMSRVTQDFDYAKDIRLFQIKDLLIKKQKEIFAKKEERMNYNYDVWFGHIMISRGLSLIGNGLIYAVICYSVLNRGLSIGNAVLYLALASSFTNSLIQFMQRFGDYNRASLEVDDFRSFIELDLGDKRQYLPIPGAEEYTIEFHDVSYRYLKAQKNAVEHLNMTLHPGEKLAVVGINGAGKTTMIKLLLRLYDPTEGYITLNGVDIRKYSREDYYKLFAPVFQNVEVLAFPIAENIAMKNTDEVDLDRALAAAEEAGLGEKIEALPKGLHTEMLKVVDENGVDFSGGEKQKLALARALYKAAPIVVLDEPTSALDALAEQQLYQRFDHMIGKKSAVYISHRLASTRFCDNIAMFKEGHMIEFGSHEALMEQNGEYTHMFNVQAQYYQEQKQEVGA